MVKAEDAPKSYADLLIDGLSKIVKAHPSYSGTIMTATYQMSRDWAADFEKLAKQKVMQAAAAFGELRKKALLGERSVMADDEVHMF